ncbi:helix-turn-helix domain-containing protein [Alkalicoccobacillus gibsonii]|uniref:helix-turn-helix domain-containing protein n=1 Tax=Alkalicoccobacillus gibsonii TaxID=79881 RepID=UPI003F7CCD71
MSCTLSKPRSKLGEFLDQHNISQTTLVQETGISKASISRLCKSNNEDPLFSSVKKIIRFLRNYDHSISYDTFWE